ncbi:MAG: hypothetical protein WAX69_04975 [Victivallales bacterium]
MVRKRSISEDIRRLSNVISGRKNASPLGWESVTSTFDFDHTSSLYRTNYGAAG